MSGEKGEDGDLIWWLAVALVYLLAPERLWSNGG